MAGLKKDFDWSLSFVKPPVINTVIDLLKAYNAYENQNETSEFLKSFFEGADSDEDIHNTKICSQNLSKKHSKIQRKSFLSREKTSLKNECKKLFDQEPSKQTNKLSMKTDNLKCSNPKLCRINADNFQIDPENFQIYHRSINEPNDIEYSDYPEKLDFDCTCASENESSSSGINSDTDESESSLLQCSRSEFFRKQEILSQTENINSITNTSVLPPTELNTSIPIKSDTIIPPHYNKIIFTPYYGDEKNVNVAISNTKNPYLNEKTYTENFADKSVQGKDKKFNSKAENRDFATQDFNQLQHNAPSKIFMNNSNVYSIQNNVVQEINNEGENHIKDINTEDEWGKVDEGQNEKMHHPNDSKCQNENRPTHCALYSVAIKDFEKKSTLLTKPQQFFLRMSDDYHQAAIKMFLHILDYREFITISLRAFVKSTDPHIKINIPFFKVMTYLLFFNLHCFTFDGIKNILVKPYPEKCMQLLNFITSEIFQKNYNKFLRFYDQNFVKTYAFDHVRGTQMKKMREEIEKYLERPITTEIRRAEIIQKPLKPDKNVDDPSILNIRNDKQQSVSRAKSLAKKKKHVCCSKTRESSQTCKEEKQRTKEVEENGDTQQPECEMSEANKSLSEDRRNKSKIIHDEYHDPVSTIPEKIPTCIGISNTENRQKNDGKAEGRTIPDVGPDLNNLPLGAVKDQTAQIPDICTLKSVTCDGCFTAKASIFIPKTHAISTFDRRKDGQIQQEGILLQGEQDAKTKHINAQPNFETNFPKPATKPPPDFSKVSIPVKPTAASVLREGACLKSNELRILQNLEWIASGGADISAVEELVEKRRKDSQQEELQAIERKHLQGLLSHEEAILARQQLLAKQRENALAIKRQKEELEKLLQIFHFEEKEKIRVLVEKIHNTEAAAREKLKEVQKMKSETVQKMVQEAREQMAEIQKKREEELMQRIALIRDLRALQELSKMKHKEIDLTETSGLGLLGEMSIAELHERLTLLKEELREDEKRKRERAQYFRAQMKQHVQETQEYINQHRSNRTPEIIKVKQMKKPERIESEELKQLRKKLTKRRELRMGYPKEF